MLQDIKNIIEELINPFLANFPILCPEKNRKPRFSGVFSGYKMGALARKGLIYKWNFCQYDTLNYWKIKQIYKQQPYNK